MRKRIAGRISLLLLTLASVALAAFAFSLIYAQYRSYRIVIAAGDPTGEGFILMKAMQSVAAREYPEIQIVVRQTGGTTDSLKLLEKGDVQFAVAQADVLAGPNALTVANLYEDNFQLLVHGSQDLATPKRPPVSAKAAAITKHPAAPSISHFSDLAGKKIALAKTGGQFKSFLNVAAHFGLKESDFVFVGASDDAADAAFAKYEADALFRVRAIHNIAIARFISAGDVILLPIDDALAISVAEPAYMPVNIRKGAYRGVPPVPSADLPDIALPRMLLVRKDVADRVVQAIAQTLMEHRQDVAAAIPEEDRAVRPLAAQFGRPTGKSGQGVSLHPGAMSFYQKDGSSFVSQHVDSIAMLLLMLVLGFFWFSELRRFSALKGNGHADELNRGVLVLLDEVNQSHSERELDNIRTRLLHLLARATKELDLDRMSEASFRSFHSVWQIAMNMVGERRVE